MSTFKVSIITTSLIVLLAITAPAQINFEQSTSINQDGTTPHSSAILDLKSTDKGLLIPRMTTAQRAAITGTEGLMIYDTTTDSFWFHDGLAWREIGGGAFEISNNVVKNTGDHDMDDFLFGSHELPQNGQVVKDTLFFFDKSNGALRGGGVTDARWSPDSIGLFSLALGHNTKATGDYGATALGRLTEAIGDHGATALGDGTEASGDNGATALGDGTEASGRYGATALGDGTEASGNNGATALGERTEASGDNGATALGDNTKASGNDGATALGERTEASGDNGATALGDDTEASGNNGATALGHNTEAIGDDGATALGERTEASGNNGATALGHFTEASGDDGATALGNHTEASGLDGATALGNHTKASGEDGATALGDHTRAYGNDGATALGHYTEANGNSCTVVGTYNDTLVSVGATVTDDSPIFIVGNGEHMNRSNALVIRKNGQIEIGSTLLKDTFNMSSNESVLRMGANITPDADDIYNSGGSNFRWNKVFATNGTIQTSDIRAKKSIINITYGLKDILNLRPVSYNWKKEKGNTQQSLGLIAQELLAVVPEVVNIPEDKKDLLGVNYAELIPVLIKSIQELNYKIESQSAEIAQLKSKSAHHRDTTVSDE